MHPNAPALNPGWIDLLIVLSGCLFAASVAVALRLGKRNPREPGHRLVNPTRNPAQHAVPATREGGSHLGHPPVFRHAGFDATLLVPRLEQVRRDYSTELESMDHSAWRQRHLIILARNHLHELAYFQPKPGAVLAEPEASRAVAGLPENPG
ncbi:MAG TPA: hypothetical protein VHI52_17800 [Verrucomicrobiae bacterium]|nr:hypothetical protein [Verrucomicrobiae bacterium]